MKQEKWDEFHKKLDENLDSEFGKAKLALREYLLENKEKVAADLDEMRKKSNHTLDTIEEAAANLADPNICKTDNWIAGAKWQQERMYSEEEVRTAILTSFLLGVDRGNYSKELEDKLIEQFKKK